MVPVQYTLVLIYVLKIQLNSIKIEIKIGLNPLATLG